MTKTNEMESTDAKLILWIVRETLSDGSVGFSVEINGELYPAITENDAEELAEGIAELIEKHTNNEAGVMRA